MRTEMLIRLEGASSETGNKGGHAASKAMKVAAAMQGVESVTLSGKDNSLLRVVGDGVDCNHLTTRLRRKVGHADVVELRTLHAGAGIYSGYGSRTGGSLVVPRDAATYGNAGGGSYYGYNTYPTANTAAPDYYYGGQQQQQQPSTFQYGYPPPYTYAAPATVHYEYYPAGTAAADPNGCSIM